MADRDIQKLVRAANQRFVSAEILYRNGAFHDSMYLAGYVVELALKAFIVARIPRQRRKAFATKFFRGARAHNFDHLWELIRRGGSTLPVAVAEHWQRIRTWSTDLRYDVGRGEPDEAEAYLESALAILKWVERNV